MKSSRREFLASTGCGVAAAAFGTSFWRTTSAEEPGKPLRVAAVITEFTYRSHAHVILENFLNPYLFNGRPTEPGVQVVSFYVDQFPGGDMSREVVRERNINIYDTIGGALCDGGDRLAVDGVLSIGEHGNYPHNEKGQHLYPRKRFFDEIVAVFRASGRAAPVFNDKHLSYRWDWAKEMFDTAGELGFPLMAGSSVPLAERRPPLQLPAGAKIEQAVSIHGGGVESYDFHALEVLQSMAEARQGGETGVGRVQFLEGDALWSAADAGRWSIELATAAMTAELGAEHELTRSLALRGKTPEGRDVPMHGVLLDYRDGLSAIALKVADSGTRWNFACRLVGEDRPRATSFYVGPWQNRNLFKALSHAIQTHFREQRAPYPVERTLLVTGILAAEMDSRFEGGRPVDTPHLAVAYQPRDFRALREMGASWKIITEDTPQPRGLDELPPGV